MSSRKPPTSMLSLMASGFGQLDHNVMVLFCLKCMKRTPFVIKTFLCPSALADSKHKAGWEWFKRGNRN